MTLLGGQVLDPKALFARAPTKRKSSSVDLTVGKMLDENGTDLGDDYRLPPGKMVFVVSEEVFNLPPNVTGFVSCKTELTHEGVWAITVGIVDPCWVGPVSTTLVNFGKDAHPLCKGDSFLRVAFFAHETNIECDVKDPTVERTAYLQKAKHTAVKFPATFLDQDKLADRAGTRAWRSMRTGAVFWGAMIALIFSALQVGSVAVDRYVFSQGLVVPASERVDELTRRVEQLEAHAMDHEPETR